MAYVYLLESEDGKHLYVGSTMDVDLRLQEHNQGITKSTRNNRPWKSLGAWEFNTLKEARQIEYKIKRMKHKFSKEYIDYFVDNYRQSKG